MRRGVLAILFIILPIFGLILAGWALRRTGVFGAQTTTELNRFVIWLALPALMFDIVAGARWADIWRPDFIAAFGGGVVVIFGGTVLIARGLRRPLADAAVDGLNAGYANTAYVGFPLAAAALGPGTRTGVLIACILTITILFAIGLILAELGQQRGEGGLGRIMLRVGNRLARNPLVVAPAAGAVVLASGLGLPAPVHSFATLLGNAASPCALVALGLFLGEKRGAGTRHLPAIAMLTGLKLVGQPLVTWVLAVHVFALDAATTTLAVLIAALPTGTGPWMVSAIYARDAEVTARVLLASTVGSVVTLTLLLNWL
ncbi:transporter [Croceibacterium mercuriale]|uniref:Transporter n=2 Tax=Croceibacterium mercuriale TaxID=1572751 RepID=A0A0B2BYG8_9SPHN|nr:transporter [Croceibacterium mercuriale]